MELAQLSKLEELDLSDNKFMGGLPEKWNDGFTRIRKLRISNGGGSGSVRDDGEVEEVMSSFGGPLISFSKAQRLEELDLSFNSFSGDIPVDFLTGLQSKDVALRIIMNDNRLTSFLPRSFTDCGRLFMLLENNLITNLPEDFCDNHDWMDGEVGLVPDRCNAIMCPPGTWSGIGRASVRSNIMCSTCKRSSDNSESASPAVLQPYYGATGCSGDDDDSGGSSAGAGGEDGDDTNQEVNKNREREILDKLYYATMGPIFWKKEHTNWTKPEVCTTFACWLRFHFA